MHIPSFNGLSVADAEEIHYIIECIVMNIPAVPAKIMFFKSVNFLTPAIENHLKLPLGTRLTCALSRKMLPHKHTINAKTR